MPDHASWSGRGPVSSGGRRSTVSPASRPSNPSSSRQRRRRTDELVGPDQQRSGNEHRRSWTGMKTTRTAVRSSTVGDRPCEEAETTTAAYSAAPSWRWCGYFLRLLQRQGAKMLMRCQLTIKYPTINRCALIECRPPT